MTHEPTAREIAGLYRDAARLATAAVADLAGRVESSVVDEDPLERVADWSDRPERTAAEVVAELLAAAWELDPQARTAALLAEQAHWLDDDSVWVHCATDHPELVAAAALGVAA